MNARINASPTTEHPRFYAADGFDIRFMDRGDLENALYLFLTRIRFNRPDTDCAAIIKALQDGDNTEAGRVLSRLISFELNNA